MPSTVTTYELLAYGNMMSDAPRMAAYEQALRKAVEPGCTVLDIGAGCGVFSLMACRLGAARVHAVEPSPWIDAGRRLAADNGYADRIEFHRCLSTGLELADKADVVVSDLRGVLPMLQGHVDAINDARARLAKPGAVFIPARDTLWVALVEDAEGYQAFESPWLKNELSLNLTSAHHMAVNTWKKLRTSPNQLLTQPQCWARLDYQSDCRRDVHGSAAATIDRAGTAHGLAIWFDAELAPGIGFSNSPSAAPLIYGQGFFPLEQAVPVEAGESFNVDLRADLIGGDYVWTWETRIARQGAAPRHHFRQSTFFSQPLPAGDLQRHSPAFVPRSTTRMEIDRAALDLVDGARSLGEVADNLLASFPGAFASRQDAIGHLAALLEPYGVAGG